jgi:hypothetical protein
MDVQIRVYATLGLHPSAYMIVRAGVGELYNAAGQSLSVPAPLDDMPGEFLLAIQAGQWPLIGSFDGHYS